LPNLQEEVIMRHDAWGFRMTEQSNNRLTGSPSEFLLAGGYTAT